MITIVADGLKRLMTALLSLKSEEHVVDYFIIILDISRSSTKYRSTETWSPIAKKRYEQLV